MAQALSRHPFDESTAKAATGAAVRSSPGQARTRRAAGADGYAPVPAVPARRSPSRAASPVSGGGVGPLPDGWRPTGLRSAVTGPSPAPGAGHRSGGLVTSRSGAPRRLVRNGPAG